MVANLDWIEIPTTMALAIMAILGYVFGVLPRRRNSGGNEVLLRLKNDLSRARMAISDLEKVVCALRNSTAKHYLRLRKFQNRVARLGTQQGDGDVVWDGLCQEVEDILDPTLQLVNEITNAQERIRFQSNYLMNFSAARTDPLTGLGNRRALEHVLSTQFGLLKRYSTPFALAIMDIDRFKDLNDRYGHLHGDKVLRDLTKLLMDASRAVDVVVRYGGDELVIVMPQTDVAGAGTLGERLRARVEQGMPFTVSVGVASATSTDTAASLFHRADAALYCAKSSGRNRTFCDNGHGPNVAPEETASTAAQAENMLPCQAGG